jgi:predicted nucleic acid-binding protein
MAKVVLDANVIISAAFGGKPLEAVTMALTKHEVYLTKSVVAELMGGCWQSCRKGYHPNRWLFSKKKCANWSP